MPRYSWKSEDLGEIGEFDFAELEAIKKFTKMLPREFGENSEKGDPLCTRMVIYLLIRRTGRAVRFEDIKGKPSEFEVHLSDEEKAEQAAAESEIVDPLTRRILERLSVNCDDELVREVVLEELIRAKDDQDSQDDELGKAPSVDPTSLTSTSTTSSTSTPPGSGTSSASTTTTSNGHRGELSSITPGP